MNVDLSAPGLIGGGSAAALSGSDKLRARIEAGTQAHILEQAARINKAAAQSETAPTAEVMSEVFETPDEVWLVSRVRSVAQTLYKDYLRLLLPYVDVEKKTIAKGAPTDDDLRQQLIEMSKTYDTFAKSNQHKTWFNFYTDRTRTDADRETVAEILDLRMAVERGELTEQEARVKLSTSRAGVLAKARMLENKAALEASGITPTKKQIKETRAALQAMKDEEKALERSKTAARKVTRGRAMSPATLAALRERASTLADRVEKDKR